MPASTSRSVSLREIELRSGHGELMATAPEVDRQRKKRLCACQVVKSYLPSRARPAIKQAGGHTAELVHTRRKLDCT
jgi:hypothetical protein